jgi:hypothetical protein
LFPIFSLDQDDDRDETDVDSEEEMEKERQKDLEERDKFAERLKEKDKEKQRSVMSKSEKKVSICESFVIYDQLISCLNSILAYLTWKIVTLFCLPAVSCQLTFVNQLFS